MAVALVWSTRGERVRDVRGLSGRTHETPKGLTEGDRILAEDENANDKHVDADEFSLVRVERLG